MCLYMLKMYHLSINYLSYRQKRPRGEQHVCMYVLVLLTF